MTQPEDVAAIVDARFAEMIAAGHLEERGKSNGQVRYKLTDAGRAALEAQPEAEPEAEPVP